MTRGYRSVTMAVLACATLSSATFASTAPDYDNRHHGTFATSDYGGPIGYVVGYAAEPAFDMRFLDAMPADRVDRRDFLGYRPLVSSPRPAARAIMATSQAGVMTTRLRRLSG